MDLRLFRSVIWRFKRLSIAGTLLAVVLAVLAYGTPTLSHGRLKLVPRESPSYQATAQLLITQANNPYGRVKAAEAGEPGNMSSLSPVYAGIANGSSVRDAIRAAKIPGTVTAAEGVDPNTGAYTPFVSLTALAPSKADVERLVERAITSFQSVVSAMETSDDVPANQRVSLQVVDDGLPPVAESAHAYTIPALVFVAVLLGLITLLFSLENGNPRTAVAPDGPNGVADLRSVTHRIVASAGTTTESVTRSVTRAGRSGDASVTQQRAALHVRGERVRDADEDRGKR